MDEVSARREARRRRILENAESRFKKITSLQCEDSQEETNCATDTTVTKSKIVHTYESKPSLYEYNDELPEFFEAIDNENEPVIQKISTQVDSNLALNRVYIILILGLVVRYLNLVFEQFEYLIGIDISFLSINKIFIPLLGYEIIDFYFNKPDIEVNVMFNIILSLNNIKSDRVHKILRIGNYVLFVLKDVSVYFFSFLIIDIAFSVVSKNI